MNREERENLLWSLAQKSVTGKMSDEEREQYRLLQEEQADEWNTVEFPQSRENLATKLIKAFRRKS